MTKTGQAVQTSASVNISLIGVDAHRDPSCTVYIEFEDDRLMMASLVRDDEVGERREDRRLKKQR
jgi:hypothetical protein